MAYNVVDFLHKYGKIYIAFPVVIDKILYTIAVGYDDINYRRNYAYKREKG